jgi:hypothetical protein
VVLIGMLGIEKTCCAVPIILLRHRFRPRVSAAESDIQLLLEQRWAPAAYACPRLSPEPEVVATVILVIWLTYGNFRILGRLLTQIERVLAINDLDTLSVDVVETARENLVIGQA